MISEVLPTGCFPTFWRSPIVSPENCGGLDVVVLGIPYDLGATFRSGSRYAPQAIRAAAIAGPPIGRSYINLSNRSEILKANDLRIGDSGDIEVALLDPAKTRREIERAVHAIRLHALPVILGGDHSITVPCFSGTRAGLGNARCGLVYVDGDPDTEVSFRALERHWHGDTIRRLIEDGLVESSDVVLIGLRGIVDAEWIDWALDRNVTVITQKDFSILGPEGVVARFPSSFLDRQLPVYVSIDIDAVDAGQAPGTSWPGWGGVNAIDMFAFMRQLARLRVAALDLVEVSPPLDIGGSTVALAVEVLWNFLRFGYVVE